jgi:opacity protein-like surface antigen
MKKTTIALFMLTTFSGYSQFGVGLKAGALLANQKFENIETEKGGIKPSFYVGAFAEYRINKFAPEIDVTYNSGGSRGHIYIRENFEGNSISYESVYDVNTVNVTGALKFYVSEKVAVKFGGYIGQIVSVKNKSYGIPNVGTQEVDLSDDWGKSDAGVLLGLNWNVTSHLFIEGGYYLGVTDMRGYGGSVQSRNLKIGAGYRF